MFGRELQELEAVQWKACPEKVWNGTDSNGTVEECRVRPLTGVPS